MRTAFCIALVSSFIAAAPASANEVETGAVMICDTQQQAERLGQLFEGKAQAAIAAINTEQNNPNACPAKSVVGRSEATIVTPEVRAQPFDATATIYFTGMRGRMPSFGVYYTLVEIDTLHSVTQLRITPPGKKATKVYMDQPPVPVPGLPDSTPTRILLIFNKKQGVIRTNKRCTSRSMARARYGFFNESPASHNNDVFHTQIADPVTASDRAC